MVPGSGVAVEEFKSADDWEKREISFGKVPAEVAGEELSPVGIVVVELLTGVNPADVAVPEDRAPFTIGDVPAALAVPLD